MIVVATGVALLQLWGANAVMWFEPGRVGGRLVSALVTIAVAAVAAIIVWEGANAALEPLGCLGDLGWYCIRFTLWAMNWRLPREVTGRILSQAGSNASPARRQMYFFIRTNRLCERV